MIPIVSFIGWQDSGKTTIVREVIARLKEKGFRVGVVKSTHHQDIQFDRPGSDTDQYRESGADAVALVAPDQMVFIADRPEVKLRDIVIRYFAEMDIVIGEGFKNEHHIAKIEVRRGNAAPLKDEVSGVVAVVTDSPQARKNLFRPDQYREITEFITREYLARERQTGAVLYVNGRRIPMKGFVQDALAGTVTGFVRSLKQTGDKIEYIDLKIRLKD